MKKYVSLKTQYELNEAVQRLNEAPDDVLKAGAQLVNKLKICSQIIAPMAGSFNSLINMIKTEMSNGGFSGEIEAIFNPAAAQRAQPQGIGDKIKSALGGPKNAKDNTIAIKTAIWFCGLVEFLAGNWTHIVQFFPDGKEVDKEKSIKENIESGVQPGDPTSAETAKKDLEDVTSFLTKLINSYNATSRPQTIKIDSVVGAIVRSKVGALQVGFEEIAKTLPTRQIVATAKAAVEKSGGKEGETGSTEAPKEEVSKVRSLMVQAKEKLEKDGYKGDMMDGLIGALIASGVIDKNKLR